MSLILGLTQKKVKKNLKMLAEYNKELRVLRGIFKLKKNRIKNQLKTGRHQKLQDKNVSEIEKSDNDREPLLDIDFDASDNFY